MGICFFLKLLHVDLKKIEKNENFNVSMDLFKIRREDRFIVLKN